MSLHFRSAYKDWEEDEEDDPISAIKWTSPEPNAVLVSGDKLVATWSTPARSIGSPSFQLCLVEAEECGDTVWPKVKKLHNGQYTITLKIPQLGSDNDFFVRMLDDKGSVYDTPEFKLQGYGSPSSALALNSGSSSSSVLPDSILPDSGLSGSITSGSGHEEPSRSDLDSLGSSASSSSPSSEGGDKEKPQSINEGIDRAAPKSSEKGSGRPAVNGTATMSVLGNSNIASATTSISSLTPTPTITNSALIGSSNDNKPSTAAIVVPLAIFAVALAGLLFSLSQRSKAKECRDPKNEPGLNRVTSNDSCASGSSMSNSGSRTDLERAMEFISGIKVSQSPRLTPLPPSIESRRRERHENEMQQPNTPLRTDRSDERTLIPASFSMPDMDQRVREESRRLPPIPDIAEPEPTDMYLQHDIPRSVTCPVIQSHAPGLSETVVYHPPAPAPAEGPTHPLPYSFGLDSGSHSGASQAVSVVPPTHLPTSLSFAGVPRPPCFVQPPVHAIPSSVSQPSAAASLIHHSVSATTAPISTLPPPPMLPNSLRAALPQGPIAPAPEIAINPSYSERLELQSQAQLEHDPTDQSPTRPRPAIPYSTRPQAMTYLVSNPYDAIAKALRTPRLG